SAGHTTVTVPIGHTLFDLSYSGNHAYSNELTARSGRFGAAKYFNGASDITAVEYSPVLEPGSAFTAEVWVNFDSLVNAEHVILSKGPDGVYFGIEAELRGDSKYYLQWKMKNASHSVITVDGTTPLTVGTWYHVAGVLKNDSLMLYLNGGLEGAAPFGGPALTSSDRLMIGSDDNGGYVDRFNGSMDELRLSSVARDPSSFALQLPPKALAAMVSGTTINLSWSNAGGALPVMRYRIYRGTDSATVSLIDSTASTSYSDPGLAVGQTYYYRVAARDVSGFEGRTSVAVSASPVDTVAPAAPQGLIAAAGDGAVTLSWSKSPESDFHAYYVYGDNVPAPVALVDSLMFSTDTVYVVGGLTNYTNYYFRITAVDSSGNESAFGNEVFAIPTDTTKPPVPVLVSAVAGNGQVTLTWNRLAFTDFANYHGYADTTAAPLVPVFTITDINDTSTVVSGLVNGKSHYFRVEAADTNGNESGFSNELSAVPYAVYTVDAMLNGPGSLTPPGISNVNANDSIVYSFSAAANHHIDSVLVDGVNVGVVNAYTFQNVSADHTIEVFTS
ncbi:MAG: hypothetical protein HUU02_17160, partial [Bacteroidetes bacterium]|nr:hypothetical protein [Bacteroidota bacterium]